MRILVTGGAGYVGSVLVPELLARGHQVTVLDDFRYRQTSLNRLCLLDSFQVVRGDCRDMSLVEPLLAGADVFIPLAAIVGAPACAADAHGAVSINFEAIEDAVHRMGGEQRILIPITNSGYGIGEPGKECTEDTPLNPISLYGVTKVDAEKVALDHGNSISLRLATVFGMSPRMRLDLLVNEFVNRALTDRVVVLFEPHFRRNYIHVTDVAYAFCFALDHFEEMKNRPYNVGLSDANLSKWELCAHIKSKLPGFIYLDAPIGSDPDKRDYVVSNARIEAAGWKPEVSLDRGIDELIKGLPMLRGGVHANV